MFVKKYHRCLQFNGTNFTVDERNPTEVPSPCGMQKDIIYKVVHNKTLVNSCDKLIFTSVQEESHQNYGFLWPRVTPFQHWWIDWIRASHHPRLWPPDPMGQLWGLDLSSIDFQKVVVRLKTVHLGAPLCLGATGGTSILTCYDLLFFAKLWMESNSKVYRSDVSATFLGGKCCASKNPNIKICIH